MNTYFYQNQNQPESQLNLKRNLSNPHDMHEKKTKLDAAASRRPVLANISNRPCAAYTHAEGQKKNLTVKIASNHQKTPHQSSDSVVPMSVSAPRLKRESTSPIDPMSEDSQDSTSIDRCEPEISTAQKINMHFAKKNNDPSAIYANDNHNTYLQNEKTTRACLKSILTIQKDISMNMREVLIDWLVEVIEEYKLCKRTLQLAVNYVDRYLSRLSVHRSKLQLVGLSAVLIAGKYEEVYPPNVEDLCYIADNTYDTQQIVSCERDMLQILDFRMTATCPQDFIKMYGSLLSFDNKSIYMASYIVEFILQETLYITIRPSLLAVVAMFLTMHILPVNRVAGETQGWPDTLAQVCVYNLSEVLRDAEKVHGKITKKRKLKAVAEKYSLHKYLQVSKFSIPPWSSIVARTTHGI